MSWCKIVFLSLSLAIAEGSYPVGHQPYNPPPPPYQQPSYQQPPYQQPPYQQPPYQQPPYQQPPYQQPPYQQPPYQQPPYLQPPYQQPPYQQFPGINSNYYNPLEQQSIHQQNYLPPDIEAVLQRQISSKTPIKLQTTNDYEDYYKKLNEKLASDIERDYGTSGKAPTPETFNPQSPQVPFPSPTPQYPQQIPFAIPRGSEVQHVTPQYPQQIPFAIPQGSQQTPYFPYQIPQYRPQVIPQGSQQLFPQQPQQSPQVPSYWPQQYPHQQAQIPDSLAPPILPQVPIHNLEPKHIITFNDRKVEVPVVDDGKKIGNKAPSKEVPIVQEKQPENEITTESTIQDNNKIVVDINDIMEYKPNIIPDKTVTLDDDDEYNYSEEDEAASEKITTEKSRSLFKLFK